MLQATVSWRWPYRGFSIEGRYKPCAHYGNCAFADSDGETAYRKSYSSNHVL